MNQNETKQEMTFEDSMSRLTNIVSSLESQQITLSESMKLFEEGLQLVEQCDRDLKQFDNQIKVLLKQHEMTGEQQ